MYRQRLSHAHSNAKFVGGANHSKSINTATVMRGGIRL